MRSDSRLCATFARAKKWCFAFNGWFEQSSGRYNNASEVVRAALRRLEDDEARLAALRSAIDEGDSSPDVEDFNRNANKHGKFHYIRTGEKGHNRYLELYSVRMV